VAILRQGRLVHLQKMSELREGRLIRARFKGEAPSLPPLDGLHERERKGSLLVLESADSLGELLAWLGRQSLEDLRVEPLGLNAVYHRFHGAEQ
jgi:hypothetical protein